MNHNPHKIMRTLRVRNDNVPGTLGHLLVLIGEQGGGIGSIRLLQESHRANVRDVTVYADDEAHIERILQAITDNPTTHLLAVRDEVLELHDKGKIAIHTPDDELVPNPLDKSVHQAVAQAVARKAIEQGLAREDFVPYVE